MDEFQRELQRDIENWWRNKFADEIEESLMRLDNDKETEWFNNGLKHAARIVRYSRLDEDGSQEKGK